MKPKTQAGYILLVLLLFLTLVVIGLSRAMPTVLSQGQREKEEELLFRGNQYKHAIGLYFKKFGRYPMKMEDLLKTNDRAFLRKEFRDPMTRDGNWRIIRVGPLGQLIGSVHERNPLGQTPGGQGAPGQGGPAGGGGEQAGAPLAGERPGGDEAGKDSPYPIAGVASRSTARSFRLYEDYDNYNEWEFIYDPVKEATQSRPGSPEAPANPPPATKDKDKQ